MTDEQLDELNYDQTARVIKGIPMTWIPALLLLLVRTGYEKGTFIKGRATRFIADNIPGEEPWQK